LALKLPIKPLGTSLALIGQTSKLNSEKLVEAKNVDIERFE
jgi:hypothetical protein